MSNNPFPMDFCPLCGSKLIDAINVPGEEVSCPTLSGLDDMAYKRHYYVDGQTYTPHQQDFVQSVVILPFIFYSESDEEKTDVMLYGDVMKPIFTVPRITDWSNPNKLVERAKKLIPFS